MTEPDDLQDDQHWLDLMAGRDAPDADARTRKSAAWLRAAMLTYRVDAPAGGPSGPDVRIRRLLARARAAGVLGAAANEADYPGRGPRAGSRWSRTLRGPQALVASLVLCASVALLMPWQADDGGDGVMRGAAVQTLTAPAGQSAAQQRDDVLRQLRAAGFDAQPFDRLARPGIDVALEVPLPAGQVAALKALGIQPPAGPSLQIEFVANGGSR